MKLTGGRRAYDLAYRSWAPWDAVGVRPKLLAARTQQTGQRLATRSASARRRRRAGSSRSSA